VKSRCPKGKSRFVFLLLWIVLIISAVWHYNDWVAIWSMVVTGYLWTGLCMCGVCRVASWRLVVLWLYYLLVVPEK
jgi:hypothetical protein